MYAAYNIKRLAATLNDLYERKLFLTKKYRKRIHCINLENANLEIVFTKAPLLDKVVLQLLRFLSMSL